MGTIRLIVGLGNPGPKYTYTRHNIGFLFVDYLKRKINPNCEVFLSKDYELFELSIATKDVKIIKPYTFMNLSGKAVSHIVVKEKVAANELLVVHDDLDIDFGKSKLKYGGGAAGHRGVISIINSLGTRDFFRLRIGIGRPNSSEKIPIKDWVLSNFSKKELEKLDEIFEALSQGLEIFLSSGYERGVSFINSLNFSFNDTSKKVDLEPFLG